jgi:lysophospholipase L1-like esterase
MVASSLRYSRYLTASVLAGVLVGCGGGGGDDGSGQFVQTWGTAAVYAPISGSQAGVGVTTAAIPYFPSTANQTTGIAAPGVAVSPPISPPANSTTTQGVYANTTIRETMFISVGGESVRLRLSNFYGTADLTVDETHIALFDKAACTAPSPPVAPATASPGITCTNIVPSSDRTVTVGGNKTFVIAKGKEIYTDPVALSLPALSTVSVSLYFKNPTPSLTVHPQGITTTYLAVGLPGTDGNFTGAKAFDAGTIGGKAALATATTTPVVDGIDVIPAARGRVIIAFGDSITDGFNTLNDANERWANFLARRFAAQSQLDGKPQVAVSQAGIGGNKVALDNANASQGVAGTTRFQNDVLSRSGVTDVIVLIGINDLTQSATPLPTDSLIAAYRELIKQAHAANVRIYFATTTPIRTEVATAAGTYGGVTGSPALFSLREPPREEANNWILTSKEHDGAFDFNGAVSAPGRYNQFVQAYNVSQLTGAGDQLHPNGIGQKLMADAVDISRFR